MINKPENQLLVEYALENEEHLEIAIKTHFVFDSIRENVIESFITSLEIELRNDLGNNWEILNDMKGNVFDQYSGLNISKKHWNKYSIRLQQEKSGAREFLLGVVKANDKLPAIPELKNKIDAEYKYGKSYPWWAWCSFLDAPYTNWDNVDALLSLYRKKDALELIKRHMIKLSKISEPMIDDLSKT